jgi:hypothetical protein
MNQAAKRNLTSRLALAFGFQYNVILFLGALLYSAALGSWVPASAAAAAELAWLIVGAFPGTSDWIEKGRQKRGPPPTPNAGSSLPALAPAHAARYEALARIAAQARLTQLDTTGVSPAEVTTTLAHLDEASRSFLRLVSLHQRLSQFLASAPSTELDHEAARLHDNFSREKDLAVRMAIRQSLNLVQRRRQHRELTINMLRAVELRIAAVEQSFAYIEMQVLPLASALELKAEVEALVARVSSVDALEAGAGTAVASPDGSVRISYPNLALDSD